VDNAASDLQYHVLVAEMAAQRGVLKTAASEYFEAAQISKSPELAERATRVALASSDDQLGLRAAQRWIQLDPKAVPPREVILRQSLRNGDIREATEQTQQIVEAHPDGVAEGLREAAIVLSSDTTHADTAVMVMRGVVDSAKYTGNAHAHYAMGLLAIRLGRLELASSEAGQAIKLDPDFQDARLLKAGALIRLGRLDKAKATIESVLQRRPGDVQVRLAYARLLLEAEQTQPAVDEYLKVLQQDDSNAEALFALGLLSLSQQDFDQAYQHFEALYNIGERRDDAAWYLGQIEEHRGHFREAYNWYGQVADGSQVVPAIARRSFVLYKLEGMDSARRYLTALRGSEPDLAIKFYQIEGELLYDTGKYPEAMQLYDGAITANPDELQLVYGRAMVEAELDHFDEAERDLRHILDLQPDDARSLNALGYLLSNHTQRYQEALGYINLALRLTPEDPSVMDSMGWVQYRLGNLEAALNYLQDAYKRQQDPEIAAHLGEVLWRLGRQDKARAVWQAALTQNPDHRVLRETVDRLSR
jgi:tetratricopeptide (TPR) repeat protein